VVLGIGRIFLSWSHCPCTGYGGVLNLIDQYLQANSHLSESERIQVQLAIEFCGEQLLKTIEANMIPWPANTDSKLWNTRVEILKTETMKQFNLLEE